MPSLTKKKIIYLIGTLTVAGAERQVVEMAGRLNRDLFDVKLYCLFAGGDLQKEVNEWGIDVTMFRASDYGYERHEDVPFTRSRKFLALWRYLLREQPDIVHAHMYKPSLYAGFAIRFLLKKPLLLTNRLSLGYFKDANPNYQRVENLVNRFTHKILANSEAVKEDVLNRERVKENQLHVIYYGVDTALYTPASNGSAQQSSALRQQWGIPESAAAVGMLANLFSYKGYEEYLRAASEVLQTYPDTYFLCIGKDRGIQPKLEQLSQKLGIADRIIYTGVVRNVPETLQMLDILVSASHEEGFSNSILEGMACGKPVVATSVGGSPEAVIDGESGLLIPPKKPKALARALLSLLKHPETAAKLGSNARKRAEKYFPMEKMIDELESLYLSLLQK